MTPEQKRLIAIRAHPARTSGPSPDDWCLYRKAEIDFACSEADRLVRQPTSSWFVKMGGVPGKADAPVMYSIGAGVSFGAELVIAGFRADAASDIVRALLIDHPDALNTDDESIVRLEDETLLRLVTVQQHPFAPLDAWWGSNPYRLRHITVADPNGFFPGDEECEQLFADSQNLWFHFLRSKAETTR